MSDSEFDDLLKETLTEYGEPGATPREAMWRSIAESRRKVVTIPWWRRPVTRVDMLVGAAAAVVLLMAGVMVGRMSLVPGESSNPLISDQAPAGVGSDGAPGNDFATGGGDIPIGMSRDSEQNRDVLRLAAGRYLTRTESFLTRWRAGDLTGGEDGQAREWARRSLTDVRLLLDSTAGSDPEMRQLLLDLELVLAQILQASSGQTTFDQDRAARRLSDTAVLPRLRSMIPAGPEAAVTQGVPR